MQDNRRAIHFRQTVRSEAEKTWQGNSTAKWSTREGPPAAFGGGGRGARGGAGPILRGSVEVTTTNLRPGYLRKNGVPYSDRTVLAEYYDRITAFTNDYLVITTVVEDPVYLTVPFITTTRLKQNRTGRSGIRHHAKRSHLRDEGSIPPADADTVGIRQIDIAGDWDHPGPVLMEDPVDRGNGPEVGDTLGVPLNEAGVLKAESYSPSWLNIPDIKVRRIRLRALSGIRQRSVLIRNTIRLRGGSYHTSSRAHFASSRHLNGWRAHPSPDAVHTFNGFSTGQWDGDLLVVETSHLKENWLRRDGVRTGDRATMIEYYIRRGNLMTVIIVLDDSVYLSEPYVRTTEYALDARGPLHPYLAGPSTLRKRARRSSNVFRAEELGGDKLVCRTFSRARVRCFRKLQRPAPSPNGF